jgi:hypothetical protein
MRCRQRGWGRLSFGQFGFGLFGFNRCVPESAERSLQGVWGVVIAKDIKGPEFLPKAQGPRGEWPNDSVQTASS